MFYSIKFNLTFDSITGQPLGPKEINVKHIIYITINEKIEKKLTPHANLRVKLTDNQIFDTTINNIESINYIETSFIYFIETYDSVTGHGLSSNYVNPDHIVQVTPIDRTLKEPRIKTTKFRVKLSDNNSIDVHDF
jgi:hypothetical protein